MPASFIRMQALTVYFIRLTPQSPFHPLSVDGFHRRLLETVCRWLVGIRRRCPAAQLSRCPAVLLSLAACGLQDTSRGRWCRVRGVEPVLKRVNQGKRPSDHSSALSDPLPDRARIWRLPSLREMIEIFGGFAGHPGPDCPREGATLVQRPLLGSGPMRERIALPPGNPVQRSPWPLHLVRNRIGPRFSQPIPHCNKAGAGRTRQSSKVQMTAAWCTCAVCAEGCAMLGDGKQRNEQEIDYSLVQLQPLLD